VIIIEEEEEEDDSTVQSQQFHDSNLNYLHDRNVIDNSRGELFSHVQSSLANNEVPPAMSSMIDEVTPVINLAQPRLS